MLSAFCSQLSNLLGLESVRQIEESHVDHSNVSVDVTAPFFKHLPQILLSLHLLYEEIKLNKVVYRLFVPSLVSPSGTEYCITRNHSYGPFKEVLLY